MRELHVQTPVLIGLIRNPSPVVPAVLALILLLTATRRHQ